MKRIVLFDTSILSENMGDKIIMDYCMQYIDSIFPESLQIHVPTHEIIGKQTYKFTDNADYKILCGTNILRANMKNSSQWNVTPKNARRINDICLMGAGWWQYQAIETDGYTRKMLTRLLSKNLIHSVRDDYTRKRLAKIGFTNVVNTACPTMWGLTEEHCREIPSKKSDAVIFTLTDYLRDKEKDKQLINILLSSYKRCFMWIQAYDDYEYACSLTNKDNITFIPPSLKLYDEFLQNNEVDYVGTRLHAGIRALNMKKRTIILSVDNRATEISRDTGLVVIGRNDIEIELESTIESEFETRIVLPEDNIRLWLSQFNSKRQIARLSLN